MRVSRWLQCGRWHFARAPGSAAETLAALATSRKGARKTKWTWPRLFANSWSETDPAANANNLQVFSFILKTRSMRNCGKAAGNQQAFMDATAPAPTFPAPASPLVDELVDDRCCSRLSHCALRVESFCLFF